MPRPAVGGASCLHGLPCVDPHPDTLRPVSTEAHKPLAAAVRTVSGLTLLSRVAGLARDLVTVRVFGASAVASAFAAALTIPNTFRRLFGEGALAAAFVPEYTSLTRDDPAIAARLASLVVAVVAIVTGVIAVVGELALALILVTTDTHPDTALSLRLIMITLPYMPLICAGAILGGMLQVHGRFAPPAAAPIILNLFIISAATAYFVTGDARHTAALIGVSVVAAGLAQVGWCLVALRPHIAWTRTLQGTRAAARRLLARFIPAVVGLGTLQLNSLIDMLIGMWPIWFGATIAGIAYPLDKLSMGILFFSQRLYQFPLGVFGIAVATAIFPLLSRHADTPDDFLATLRRGIRLSLFIGLPATVGLALVRTDLIAVMYTGAGGYEPAEAARAASVLLGYAVAVWAYSLNHLLTRAFYARQDTTTPMRIALAMVGVNLALNFALIWHLREAGLAWATAIAACLQTGLLALVLRRHLDRPIFDRDTRAALLRLLLASSVMGSIVAGLSWLLPPGASWLGHLGLLFLQTGVGIGVYALLSHLLDLQEFKWLVKVR